jgi:hypothetical protein
MNEKCSKDEFTHSILAPSIYGDFGVLRAYAPHANKSNNNGSEVKY